MTEKPSNTRQACAFEQGQRAVRTGKTNPHKKNSVDHLWWAKGYDSVKEAEPCN